MRPEWSHPKRPLRQFEMEGQVTYYTTRNYSYVLHFSTGQWVSGEPNPLCTATQLFRRCKIVQRGHVSATVPDGASVGSLPWTTGLDFAYSSGQHNLYRKNVHKQPYSHFLFSMRNPIKQKYHEAAIGKAIKRATKIGICRVKSH